MIGVENKPVVEVLKKLTNNGVGIILDTMRSDEELREATKWFEDRGIELYGVGRSPGQEEWSKSNKCYAARSIDDRNLGVPLIYEENEKPRVDWETIDRMHT